MCTQVSLTLAELQEHCGGDPIAAALHFDTGPEEDIPVTPEPAVQRVVKIIDDPDNSAVTGTRHRVTANAVQSLIALHCHA